MAINIFRIMGDPIVVNNSVTCCGEISPLGRSPR